MKSLLPLKVLAGAFAAIFFLVAPAASAQSPAPAGNATYSTSSSYNYASSGPSSMPVYADWHGPYIGINGGANFGNFNSGSAAGPTGSDTSGIGGVQFGNNWQTGPVVLGAECDLSGMDLDTQSAASRFREDAMATVRARIGYAISNVLPYATAGLALTDVDSKVKGVGNDSHVAPGLAIGGGVEMMLNGMLPHQQSWARHLTTRIEYLHVNVPEYTDTIGGTPVTGGSNNNLVRIGLNYRF